MVARINIVQIVINIIVVVITDHIRNGICVCIRIRSRTRVAVESHHNPVKQPHPMTR